MDIIKSIEHEQLKNKIPELKVGNTVRVHVRIKEGNKERIQVFEGIIIKVQGGGVNKTFTVRKISYGVGVEKTFLVHSPLVEKVELVRVGKARRAKLFYLRDRVGKASRTKEQLGARIENKEITLKEDMVEEPVSEEVVSEAPVEEVAQNKTEETVVAQEEVTAVETTEEVAEEVVDTVKEDRGEGDPDALAMERDLERLKADNGKGEFVIYKGAFMVSTETTVVAFNPTIVMRPELVSRNTPLTAETYQNDIKDVTEILNRSGIKTMV